MTLGPPQHFLDNKHVQGLCSPMMQAAQAYLETGLQRLHQKLLTKRNAVVIQVLN